MDNLSHTLVGIHLARLPAFRSIGPRLAFWTGVAASNAPDVDGVLRFWSERAYIFEHRGITHSLLAALLIAPLVAAIAGLVARRPLHRDFLPLLGLSLAGVAVHLFFDLITSWGTMLLLPFSHARLALPWVFVLDVVVWAILGIPLLRTAWRRRRGGIPDSIVRRSSVATLSVLSLYIALCALGHERARRVALAQLPDGAEPEEVLAFPVPPGPLLWTTAVRDANQVWHRGFASVLTGGVTHAGQVPTGLDDPRVQVALETELGSTYRWFAAALYRASATELAADGSYQVTLADLRFSGPFREEVPFQLWMEIGPDFRVRAYEFRTGRLSAEEAAAAPSPLAGDEGGAW